MRSNPPSAPRRVRSIHESKSATVRAAAAAPSRRQLSRWQREQQHHRWLLLVVGALAVLVAAILAIGWVWDNVFRANEPVATVYGSPITARELVEEMRINAQAIDAQTRQATGASRAALQQQAEQQKRALPDQALDTLVESRIVQREASRRGISVTPEDVDAEVRKNVAQFQAFTSPTPEAAPTPTEEPSPTPEGAVRPTATPLPTLEPSAFSAAYQRLLDRIGLSDAQYRHEVSRVVLAQKVQDAMAAEVPTTQEAVHAQHILLPDEASANAALAQLQAGADFGELARQVSTDPGSKDKGGDLGWFPRGVMNAPFEEQAFALAPGQVSGVFQSPNGFHIVRVLEKDSARPLDPAQLEQAKSSAYQQWLSDQRSGPDVRLELTNSRRDWVLRQIGVRP